jgi:hypothetical protein
MNSSLIPHPSSFGKVAVLMGGGAGARSRGPACGDATVEVHVGRPGDAARVGDIA